MRRKRRLAPVPQPVTSALLQRAHREDTRWAAVEATIAAPGRPLEPPMRHEMETRFRRDFSGVRIHTDAAAARSAAGVQAAAYTVGEDVVFGAGRYAPASVAGRRLLAHELAHTVRHAPRRDATHLLRQAVAGARSPQAELVDDTIRFFEASADFWALADIDQARFDRVLTSWYTMIVRQDEIIDQHLNGDPARRQRLRTAYIAVLRTFMGNAARALGITVSDLYRRNSGRIPMWAWQVPHHMERRISTPIAEGRAAGRAGEVRFVTNGFRVTIRPDRRIPGLGRRAETNFNVAWGGVRWRLDRRGRVTRIIGPPVPLVVIQTSYGRQARAGGPSSYGRGTTPEDVAGGTVTPASTSLGFHEGTHGLDFVAFLEAHPPPVFEGAVGMTGRQIAAAGRRWRREINAYAAAMSADSLARTDCVGTTIDVHARAGARPGARIRMVCP